MNFEFSSEDEAFRDEVRSFLTAYLPETTARHVRQNRPLSKQQVVEWQRVLNAKGWATPRWPREWGGTGWSATQIYIFTEEYQRACAPDPLAFGVAMVGPVIIQFGTAEQKRRFLPRIANLDDWWCQGFSEPGAGSDLASLSTRAVRDGDGWVLNGQKTWTTYAHYADWMFALVRTTTEKRKQAGISFMLIDMKHPGVTVRPIITIDGAHEINEVFLDDVRVPDANVVGEIGQGWSYAKFLLGNERFSMARVGLHQARLAEVRRLARSTLVRSRRLWDHPRFRDRFTMVEIELKALEMTTLRVLSRMEAGAATGRPDPASSVIKLKSSFIMQAVTELFWEVAGNYVLPAAKGYVPGGMPEWADAAAAGYYNHRKATIYGGSSEIQKSIIASKTLGL